MQKNYFVFTLSLVVMIFIFSSCDSIEQWQEKYLAQRYGGDGSKNQMELWQQEAAEYQDEMEEQIATAEKAAAVYRSLANAFAVQEAWQLCITNMQKSIEFGNNNLDTLFDLATCQGNLARSKNWQYQLTHDTENTLLSILQREPTSVQARYRLALVYFYGYGQNSPYRVLSQRLTIEQKDFQKQAMTLLQQSVQIDNQNPRVFHLMAAIYSAWGEKQNSLEALNQEIEILRQKNPETYTTSEEYRQAMESIKRLGVSQ